MAAGVDDKTGSHDEGDVPEGFRRPGGPSREYLAEYTKNFHWTIFSK
jgi:hypothetical protein